VVLHERERHKEAIRGRYAAYYATMIEQRDGFYADRIKVSSHLVDDTRSTSLARAVAERVTRSETGDAGVTSLDRKIQSLTR
jgi:hypothetical protein